MEIKPVDRVGPHKTGKMEGVSVRDITKTLGFPANIDDDPDKVKYSWGFEVDGEYAAIWDYKGSYREKYFSTYDPHKVLPKLFPNATF